MYSHMIPKINEDLKRTQKAIISLGCSFVQGHGAIDEYIYRNYPWTSDGTANIFWKLSEEQIEKLTQEYPNIRKDFQGGVNFSQHQYDNAFVNVLCKKYFNGEYTPINLGRSGNGNRATIKDLYFYPDLLWDEMKEIIVIYCPSGGERVDFIDDTTATINNHGRWITAWPNEVDDGKGARNTLWTGIRDSLSSEKFEVFEQISNVQELVLWCKFHKAKLVIVPAFMQHFYTKEYFSMALNKIITRDKFTGSRKIDKPKIPDKSIERIVNMWPWENMYYPGGTPSFADYSLQQEYGSWEKAPYFYTFQSTGSPELYITPCAHPSGKAHDAFAKLLFEHLTGKI